MGVNITVTAVEGLKRPKSGSKIYYDKAVSGFGARITYAGSVCFVLNYVTVKGEEKRCTLGHYPEMSPETARAKANRLRDAIRQGADPLQKLEPDSTAAPVLPAGEQAMVDLANGYMAAMRKGTDRKHKQPKRASTLRNDRQMLELIVLPKLGTLAVAAVTKDMIDELHDSLRATPYRANRVLSLLSGMFGWARRKGWRADNPVRDVERYRETPREQYLTEEAAVRLWKALDAYPEWVAALKCRKQPEQMATLRRDAQSAADALQLLCLTGARKEEVLAARWEQFNLSRGIWIKPAHTTKQNTLEEPPLSNLALSLLARLQADRDGDYLFPGRKPGTHRATLMRPWKYALKAAGLAGHEPAWRIHDLRHFFASYLVSGGDSLALIGKLMGHRQVQTTARYGHLFDQPQRDAVNRLGRLFEPITKKPRRPGARTPKRRSTTVTR